MLVKNKLGFTRKIWPQNALESLLRTFWIRNISLGRPYPPTRGVVSLVLPPPTPPPPHTHTHTHTHTRAFDTRKTHTTFQDRTTFQKSTTTLESVSSLYWWKHRQHYTSMKWHFLDKSFIEDFHNLEVSIEITQRWLHPVVVFTGADSPEPSLLV